MDRYIVDSRVGCVAVVDTKKYEGVCLTADMPGVVAWWDGVIGAKGWEVPAWADNKAIELCALLNAAQQGVHLTPGTSRQNGKSKRKVDTVKSSGSPRRK